jgi:hypothetical protein
MHPLNPPFPALSTSGNLIVPSPYARRSPSGPAAPVKTQLEEIDYRDTGADEAEVRLAIGRSRRSVLMVAYLGSIRC